MSITEKIVDGVEMVTATVRNGVDSCKVEVKIAEHRKIIRDMTREIGVLAVESLDSGATMTPAIMERYAAIKEARKEIEACDDEKKPTKVECPKCGEKVSTEMTYCGKCGTNVREQEKHECHCKKDGHECHCQHEDTEIVHEDAED